MFKELRRTSKKIEELHHVHGDGSKRERRDHIGFASYRGTKNTTRQHPRPFVSDESIGDHQCYNEANNNNQLAQPFFERTLNDLGDNAMLFGRQEHPRLFKVINNCCLKLIITSGSPKSYPKQNPTIDENDKTHHVK